MAVKLEVIGTTYGRLTVLRDLPRTTCKEKRQVECLCSCGIIKRVALHHLRSGDTLSCGCLKVESTKKSNTTHGATAGYTKGNKPQTEYVVWSGIRSRCKPGGHKDYSERGITMCESWWNSYETFYAEMGTRPSPFHSIDRVDNNKGYCKENCRWATGKEQSGNRRSNRRISYCGSVKILSAWCEELGKNSAVVYVRLRKGWTPFQALFTPLRHRKLPDNPSWIEVPREPKYALAITAK